MPGEQLRRARIALLKATHFPYIAAIWAYEGTKQYLSSTRKGWQHTLREQKRPVVGSHLDIRRRATRYPALRTRSEASLLAKTPRSEVPFYGAGDLDALMEIKKTIEQLSRQVEDFSHRVVKPSEVQQHV
ncbi:hypothetical protein MMC07_005306 [Pseudocyphellaria aurata]|nr:hypothetical protein [Pseudocyphellaria aurata]